VAVVNDNRPAARVSFLQAPGFAGHQELVTHADGATSI
jgi:hypothetical protein